MIELIQILHSRLQFMEEQAQQRIIPGEQDSYDLEELIGRIKELKFLIKLIAANLKSSDLMKIIQLEEAKRAVKLLLD